MKTITLFFCLFISISIFCQTHPFAIHPDCSTTLDSLALKQCSEEKIVAAIHERIRYKHYGENQHSKVELEFDINDQGIIEPIAITVLNGIDVKTDVESALKHLSYQTIFKPAEEEGFTFYDNKKLVVKFTETAFLLDRAEEKTPAENKALAQKYLEGLPISTTREIFKVVEQMPRFFSAECEELEGDNKAKKACSDKKMLEFIYKNIKYPAIARENGVEGTVVIQFIVEKNGTITGAKTIRDIGAQCGAEALRVVNAMNDFTIWTPGMQRGEIVPVQFNLPIKFRLGEERDRY